MGKLFKLEDLTGFRLQALDGELGELKQVYFDDQLWSVCYLVVHTGSWLLGRKVLISPQSVTEVDPDNARLSVNLTQDKVKNSPPAESEKPVSRYYEEELFRYYQWERYWITDALTGIPASPLREQMPRIPNAGHPEHPHLRSSDEVRGYRIHAIDGDIGHVEDFLVEEPHWSIAYLEIDTLNWLPGKHVLIAPAWIRQIDWEEPRRGVTVELAREAIRTAPAYDAAKAISRDYQVTLSQHYAKRSEKD